MRLQAATTILITSLLIHFALTQEYWIKYKSYLKQDGKNAIIENVREVMSTLEGHPHNFSFTEFLGGGSYGGVLRATNSRFGAHAVAVKIMPVVNSKECQFNEILVTIKTRGAKYTLSSFDRQEINTNVYGKRQLFCVLTLEAGLYSLKGPFLQAFRETAVATQILRKIVIEFLESVYTLNFIAGFLHGDLKPENAILLKNQSGEYEMRLIDFDLTVEPSTQVSKYGARNTDNVLYTQGFRPPEMELLCPGMDCFDTEVANFKVRAEKFQHSYNLDLKFREDSWSAAKTLSKIFEKNRGYYNADDVFLRYVETSLLPRMLEAKVDSRLTTEEAFEEAFEEAKQKFDKYCAPLTKVVGSHKIEKKQPPVLKRDKEENLNYKPGEINARLQNADLANKVQKQLHNYYDRQPIMGMHDLGLNPQEKPMLQPYKVQREPSYHQAVIDNKPKQPYFDQQPQEKPMLQPYKLQREPSYHQVVLDNKPKRLYFDLNPQEKPMLQPHELKKETNYHQAILDRKPKWSNFDQKLQEKPMLQPYELQKETNYYQEVIDARPKRSYSSNQYGGVHAGYVPGYQPTTHYVPRQESYRAGFAEIGVGYRGQPSGTRYQHYQRVLI